MPQVTSSDNSVNYCFKGRVALITGAASGMGLATAKAFTHAGASVAMIDISEEALAKARDDITEDVAILKIVCDVSKEQLVALTVQKVIDKFGKIDFAFNNAGIQVPPTKLGDFDHENYRKVLSVNLDGVFNFMKYELKEMSGMKSGVIVNNASIGGILGAPNLSAYAATKHGVIGLTKSAAIEYADQGIRVNAICPGTIATPMVVKMGEETPGLVDMFLSQIPMKRMGRPEEIADVVLWLSSSASSFINGQSIVVDGGQTIS